MTTVYIVCRLCPAVLPIMAMAGVPAKSIQETTWNAPILDGKARAFTDQKDANRYCKKMNEGLRIPLEEGGVIHIDASPYTDFVVLTVQKG